MNTVTVTVGIILLLVLVGMVTASVIRRLRRVQRVEAVVLDKQVCQYSQASFGKHGFLNRSDGVVLFSVNGKTTGLMCPKDLYDSLSVGKRGILVYKESKILEFHEQEPENAPC